MPSGLLYRLRGTADVWRLYFDYEPAPTGDLYATPPLEVPLAHGDEVSPLQPFLISVGRPNSLARKNLNRSLKTSFMVSNSPPEFWPTIFPGRDGLLECSRGNAVAGVHGGAPQ